MIYLVDIPSVKVRQGEYIYPAGGGNSIVTPINIENTSVGKA
jgi:hypothetical protein